MENLLRRAKLDPDAWYPTQEVKRLRLADLLSQMGAAIELGWALTLMLFGPYWRAAVWNLAAAASFLLIPRLKRLKRLPLLSRLGLITLINCWIFVFACLYEGKNATQFCYIPMSSVPFIPFDTRHRASTLYGVVLPQILFIVLELTKYRLFPAETHLTATNWTYWLTVATAFIISFLAVLAYRRANEKFEQELRETQGRFVRIVESAQEGICVCDSFGRIAYINPALSKLLGDSTHRLLGRSAMRLLSGASRGRINRFSFEKRTEVDLVRADGRPVTVWISTSPLYEDRPQGDAVIALILDVTENRAQNKLIEDQRTKIAATAKLSALGEMAAGIAHEIYNPLTAIRLGIGMLEDFLAAGARDVKSAKKITRQLETTIVRIVRIIEGLKAFSREDRSAPMLNVPLARVVDDTLALCRERFRANGVELVVSPIAPDVEIRARAVEISQVLLNLLNNAFYAVLGQNTRRVALEVGAVGDQIEISVSDNGSGIPREIQGRIYEPFFTTKPVGVGTGLGLSVSKGIVEAHGGKLGFESRPGETRFRFKVPRAERRAEAA